MQKSAKYREESAVLDIKTKKIVSKDMPVFYNPVMKLNRDIAVLLLKAWKRKNLSIADVLAGSGVRAVRFLKELPASKIKNILINDANPNAVKLIKKHLTINKVKKKAKVTKNDASIQLLTEPSQDYIEIDPFGSPNPFLDSAVKKLKRNGILAITATDTAALAGSSPKSCLRKYWAKPLKNRCMHELGIRILVRKAQLIGAQHEKALIPVFCHSTAHYVRVYLHCVQGRGAIRQIFNHHGYFMHCTKCTNRIISSLPIGKCCNNQMDYAGPLWLGELFDAKLADEMNKLASGEAKKLLEVIAKEAKTKIVGFYDIHELCSKLGISSVKKSDLIRAIKSKKASAVETHFSPQGIKTEISISDLKQILLSLSN